MQNYLENRTDDNPALFVSLKSPHERLKIGGVEVRLREFGKQLGINKVHPHKFRRTLATVAIDKGMAWALVGLLLCMAACNEVADARCKRTAVINK